MREIVLARIEAYWYDELEDELELTLDQVKQLQDEELLNVYDRLVGFDG